MAKRKIVEKSERCTGCMTCMLACSMFNFGFFSLEKTYISVARDDRNQRFAVSIGSDCKACGDCVRSCAYEALGYGDENSSD